MTEVIPDTTTPQNVALWADAELAKRWVLANLARWGWFTSSDDGPRPVFRLLSEQTSAGETAVTMGHADGVVTINVIEADPAERVRRRVELGEPLRTMIGHFRHELGHFFFTRLAERPEFLEAFRAIFGDERADYAAALQRHYADGPPADWRHRHDLGLFIGASARGLGRVLRAPAAPDGPGRQLRRGRAEVRRCAGAGLRPLCRARRRTG